MDIKSFLKKIRNAFKRITTPVARKLISVVERILVQNGLLKKFGIMNWRIPYGIARKTVITISANRSLYTYYLQGTGIEIGALHGPLRILHNNAKVKYVDYTSTTDLKKRYPNLDHIVNVDIISSAEDLEGTEDDSLCFIIANHVIEHIANPIKTLERWHKKLKNEGILYLAFPDAMRCPDKVKRINSLSHHVKDYLSDTKEANDEHLLGFVYA